MGPQRHKNHGGGKCNEQGSTKGSHGDAKGRKGRKGKGVKTGLFGTAAELRSQLGGFGLRLQSSVGDGNCLFRSLSDQVVGHEQAHPLIRALAVAWLAAHESEVLPFLDEDEDGSVQAYCERMARDCVWGGNLELVAVSGALECEITVHQSGHPSYSVATAGKGEGGGLHVGYSDGDHYDSVRLASDHGGGPAVPIHMPSAANEAASRGEGRPHPWPRVPIETIIDRLQIESRAGGDIGTHQQHTAAADPVEEGEACGEVHEADRSGSTHPSPASASEHSKNAWRARKCAEGAGKPKRAGPCPCGSLKAYRKCCEGVHQAAQAKAKALAEKGSTPVASTTHRNDQLDSYTSKDRDDEVARLFSTIAI